MAEFSEVVRQAKRFCMDHHNCSECTLYDVDFSCPIVDVENVDSIERIVMQWAAEHPETRYPTWEEWQKANFPDAQVPLYPCNFARCDKNFIGCFECDFYRESAIPAGIAQKLGIKPITEERVDQ